MKKNQKFYMPLCSILLAAGILCLFNVSPTMAQVELKVVSETVVDPDAGVGYELGGSGRNLTTRVARDSNGNPIIVYVRDYAVYTFWCDNKACTSGTNELVLPPDGTERPVVLSPVVLDSAGGPHFIASVYDIVMGHFAYVQCSPTTCANPTEYTTQPDPPAAPLWWNYNVQRPNETWLYLKPEDNDGPTVFVERGYTGFDVHDCSDGQYCDPYGNLFAPMDQHIFLDVKRDGSYASNVMSLTNNWPYDFELNTFECIPDGAGGKDCSVNQDVLLDTIVYNDIFNGVLGYDWVLNGGGIRAGVFDLNGYPKLTLSYSARNGMLIEDADMFALLQCNDALCATADVTMIDAQDGYRTGYMDPHVAVRPDSGSPVMAYRLCEENEPWVLGDGCEMNVAACDTPDCDANITTAALTEDIYGHVEMNVESEGVLALSYRTAAGELVFSRVEMWDTIDITDFEGPDWGIYTDGGKNCRLSDKDSSHAYQGSYTVRLNDDKATSMFYSATPMDLSAYSTISVSFWYKTSKFDNGDGVVVEFYDAVTGWQTVGSFTYPTYGNDTFHNPTVLIDADTYNLGAAQFRFSSTANDRKENSYFDLIKITAN